MYLIWNIQKMVTNTSHRWSGWPGAWCLDCGREDPTELCAIEHEEDCSRPECNPGKCSEPNSHRFDPYQPPMREVPSGGPD